MLTFQLRERKRGERERERNKTTEKSIANARLFVRRTSHRARERKRGEKISVCRVWELGLAGWWGFLASAFSLL